MSATTVYAKQDSTGRILHITEVDKKLTGKYLCADCRRQLIVVKSDARKRDWHFRHFEGIICTGSRSTALHDFAVQTLMESASLTASKDLRLNYTDPRAEIGFCDFRSDVCVKYEGEDIHIEVFVTNDLKSEKISAYESNNIKCIRIDLSNPDLLSASKEKIIDEVLNRWENKTLIGWQPKVIPAISTSSSWTLENIVTAIFAFVVIVFSAYLIERFITFLFRPRYRRA